MLEFSASTLDKMLRRFKYAASTLMIFALLLGVVGCSLQLPASVAPPQYSNTSEQSHSEWSFPQGANQTTPLPQFPEIIQQVKPAVVSITTTTNYTDWWGQEHSQQSAGSGIIIDSEGYIVTNNHVVEDATSITVKLYDGRILSATVVGTDAQTDLAVIKISATELPYAKIGNSSQLREGDWVLSLGNALGQGAITTVEGIVSALDVSIRISATGNTLHNLILVDAPINPGDSGGPLVNMAGEVVGINFAKVVEVSVEGMGYAISIDQAKPIIEKLIQQGFAQHPWLGVQISTVDSSVAAANNFSVNAGALVLKVFPDSPAEQAELMENDIIIKFNNRDITTAEDLYQAVQSCNVGDDVKIVFMRGKKKQTIFTHLEQIPY